MPAPALRYTFRGQQAEVTALCFAQGDQYLVSGDNQGRVYVWDLVTKRVICRHPCHANASVLQVAQIQPDRLLTQGRDNMFKLWTLELHRAFDFAEGTASLTLLAAYAMDTINFCRLSYQWTPSNQLMIAGLKNSTLHEISIQRLDYDGQVQQSLQFRYSETL
ncbi:Astra associated protein 1 Asa1, partial [Dimargaris xerosporica]